MHRSDSCRRSLIRLKKITELSELSREIARKEYNLSRREKILFVDYKQSIHAHITKALEEMRQGAQVIRQVQFAMNPYLHDTNSEASTRYKSLMGE
jgi:hypothetical protein